MRVVLLLLTIAFLAAGYSARSFYRKVRASNALIARAVPFTLKGDRAVSVLVIGDSTAVGVGAETPEESLAGLLAHAVHATSVDNFARSGARVRDLAKQVQEIRKEKYNFILVGIGANDVVRFGSADMAAGLLNVILDGLPKHDRLIVYMAGNVGATRLFPYIFRWRLTARSIRFHDAFLRAVTAAGGAYVNLYIDPANDPFVHEAHTYFAADTFHPSSVGYAEWFKRIQTVL